MRATLLPDGIGAFSSQFIPSPSLGQVSQLVSLAADNQSGD